MFRRSGRFGALWCRSRRRQPKRRLLAGPCESRHTILLSSSYNMTPRALLALLVLAAAVSSPAAARRHLLAPAADEAALVQELVRIWRGDKLTREQADALEGTWA